MAAPFFRIYVWENTWADETVIVILDNVIFLKTHTIHIEKLRHTIWHSNLDQSISGLKIWNTWSPW